MRTQPRLTDDQRAHIAHLRIDPLRSGNPERTIPAIAAAFKDQYGRKLDSRTITNALYAAFQNDLVRLETHLPLPPSTIDTKLSSDITNHLNIPNPIVVRPASTPDTDMLHKQLGFHLAMSVRQSPAFFRNNDVVAIGSGRATHNFVMSLIQHPKIEVSPISIISLTGTVYPEAALSSDDELLDADLATLQLAKCFRGQVLIRNIAHNIAHENVSRVRCRTWLYDPHHLDDDNPEVNLNKFVDTENKYKEFAYSKHIPTHSFVGIGVLNDRHRLVKEIENSRMSRMLDPIRTQLQRIIHIIKEIRERCPEYYPVGDICHRLFFIEPEHSYMISEVDKQKLVELIISVNIHTLTVTKTQLARSANLCIVAGGSDKVGAIREVINNRKVNIKTLCTDSWTAESLLKYRQ